MLYDCILLLIVFFKTEWSREEDEKLLHLAKIMPCQWRSIAPMVGRTAAQCLERYEKLLDSATNIEDEDEETRKLRSEVDMDPENKPALPDAVDMEEDEKEMLQEARARLACTKGKKAKRKAREKQLENARRLASIQKKRELKAAGIDVGSSLKKKMKGINYNKEIPFLHTPAPGFYDTNEEARKPSKQISLKGLTMEKLEGQTRADIEEKLRKKDTERQREMLQNNKVNVLEKLNKLNALKQEQIRKRAKLSLPDAQISDAELNEIAKMTYELDEDAEFGAPTPNPHGTSYMTPALATPHFQQDRRMLEKQVSTKLASLPKPKTVKVEVVVDEHIDEEIEGKKILTREEEKEQVMALINEEMNKIDEESYKYDFGEDWINVWLDNYDDIIYLPEQGKYILKSTATATDKVAALQHIFDILSKPMEDISKKISVTEKRVTTYQTGYMRRCELLNNEICKLSQNIAQAKIDKECFKMLQELEEHAIEARILDISKRVTL